MRLSTFALLLSTLAIAAPALAEEPPPPAQVPPPPPMSAGPDTPADRLEPEVTIRQQGEDRVTEYRVNGRLYMIKVKPKAGPAYYLTDTDGDGNLETRQTELDPAFLIPKWILLTW